MKEVNPKLKKVLVFLKNKYVIVTIVFIYLILFSRFGILEYRRLNNQRNELIDKKVYYENEIKKDSTNTIKLQKSIKEMERFGREKYMMKRENEDIFIIKSAEDTLQVNKK